jgi:hypothetical protein
MVNASTVFRRRPPSGLRQYRGPPPAAGDAGPAARPDVRSTPDCRHPIGPAGATVCISSSTSTGGQDRRSCVQLGRSARRALRLIEIGDQLGKVVLIANAGILLERGRPLVAMLFAPAAPTFIDMGRGIFFERLCLPPLRVRGRPEHPLGPFQRLVRCRGWVRLSRERRGRISDCMGNIDQRRIRPFTRKQA